MNEVSALGEAPLPPSASTSASEGRKKTGKKAGPPVARKKTKGMFNAAVKSSQW